MHVDECITYIRRAEDRAFLRTPLLDVNIRLFRQNAHYWAIVKACCDYHRFVALQYHEGYGQPFGISGANLAIPFNIIGVVRNRGTEQASCQILINPEILEYLGPLIYTKSNCGSIRLPEPIDVLRYDSVRVRYYNEAGVGPITHTFSKREGSYTIQHEVDHNKGILITDYGRIVADGSREIRKA